MERPKSSQGPHVTSNPCWSRVGRDFSKNRVASSSCLTRMRIPLNSTGPWNSMDALCLGSLSQSSYSADQVRIRCCSSCHRPNIYVPGGSKIIFSITPGWPMYSEPGLLLPPAFGRNVQLHLGAFDRHRSLI